MARPQKFNREKVTEKARDLFWKKGYNAVSVQDLAQTMEISRSSFYNSFTDKDRMFLGGCQRRKIQKTSHAIS